MSIKKSPPFAKLFLLLGIFMIAFAQKAMATHELGSARLVSPNITVNNTLFLQDNKYPLISAMPSQSTWGFYDKSYGNKLSLAIDRYSLVVLTNFVASVTVQITSVLPQALGGTTTVSTKTLSVSYEGVNDHQSATSHASSDQQTYTFTNGYAVLTKILNISVSYNGGAATTVMPSNVYLQSEADAERYYPLNPVSSSPYVSNTMKTPFSASSNVTVTYLSPSDEFEVAWVNIPGAEEYDLEWIWLDGKKNTLWYNTRNLDFRNNSTRVRTAQQSYRISNVFEEGQVFFRVRAVGRAGISATSFDKEIFTPWSWPDFSVLPLSSSSPYFTSTYQVGSSFLFYTTITANHETAKNWQYKATYAEEGKKKEVISYFDGTLRSRQAVTKNNSDNHAIVGETYYDYNGRAAVQALPVPLVDSKIKFYQYSVFPGNSGFNFDLNNLQAYDKKSFDVDATPGVCSVIAAGIDFNMGSANYYSEISNFRSNYNPGYVSVNQDYTPNSEFFPISQTEFTNDNTGRIARQGGVGVNHQLGTGHETRYFYGAPEQVELDRLFGSEVGYNSHYKKNMVIDANGQVSISYLDQQGRTVATALSGQAPGNVSALKDINGNLLYTPPAASNLVTADLLNKANATDFDTDLDNNSRVGDELTFNKKILVPTASTYTISYDLQGTAYTYSCLPANVCYDCIYDLEINIVDNCQNNPTGFTKITKTLGTIISPATGASQVVLDSLCNQTVNFSTSQLNSSGNQLLVDLQQGEYTITKTLKINEDALSFYLGKYLNSNCVKKLQDFNTGISPDTSGCSLTCDQCLAALGTQSLYISSGKGTAEDWLREYKVCKEPCEYVSMCEAEYITLLADVSPGGQYGDWEDNAGACNPSLYNLSVFNENNQLPTQKNLNIVGTKIPTWKNPFRRLNTYPVTATTFTAGYYDDNGKLDSVYVTRIPNPVGSTGPAIYSPPVASGAVVTPLIAGNANIGDVFAVRPQDLANVSDFIANWQNSWATSLVFYHPEYPYYDWCLKNSTQKIASPYVVTIKTNTTTIASSDDYDSLLLSTDDIIGLSNADLVKLGNPLTNDPYWTTSGYYYTNGTSPSTSTGATVAQLGSSANLPLVFPWAGKYRSGYNRYMDYQKAAVSLPVFAAIISTSCAIQYGLPITPNQLTCLTSILNSTPGPLLSNLTTSVMTVDGIINRLPTTLQNKYWDNFRMMYQSLKQEMQQEAAESYAMNGDFRGCNDCIGDPNFDQGAFTVPFTQYAIFTPYSGFPGSSYVTAFFNQWFFPIHAANKPQYCNGFTGSLYTTKIKRFPNSKNATDLSNNLSAGDPGASVYASTGLCPNAFYFQGLLNALGTANAISSPTLNLSTIPEFNQDLYKVVSNGIITNPFIPVNWTASNTALSLNASIKTGTNTSCPLVLNFPSGYPFDFSNTGNGGAYSFLKFYHLIPGSVSGGSSNFTIQADVALSSGSSTTYTTITLSGSTCIPLTGCTFTPPCAPTTQATAIQRLLNVVAATGNMCSSTIAMSDPTIQPYFINTFAPMLGNGTWKWKVDLAGIPNFVIYDDAGVSLNTLKISFANLSACTSGNTFAFANITGNNTASNAFNISVNQISGSTLTTYTTTGLVLLNGQPLKMGICGFDNIKCTTQAHQTREDLQSFLLQAGVSSTLSASSTVLLSNGSGFGINLRNQLADNYQTGSTVSTNPLYFYWMHNATAVGSNTLLTGSFFASTLTAVTATPSSACSFSLQFADPATAITNGHSLNSPGTYTLSNFILASGPTVNSNVYDFSVTATFSGTNYILSGTSSCFGMRPCTECKSTVVNASSSSPSYILNNFDCTGNASFSIATVYLPNYTVYSYSATPCSGSANTFLPYSYVIANSANLSFAAGSPTFWTGFNSGSSLFFAINTGATWLDGMSYKQNFYVSSSCSTYKLSFKLHVGGSVNGSSTQAFNPSVFSVNVNNGTPLTCLSVNTTSDPNWYEYVYNISPNTVGVMNTLTISGFNTQGMRMIGLDEIRIVPTCVEAGSVPCVNIETFEPMPDVEYEDPCVQYALDVAQNDAQELYNTYIDSMKNAFVQGYIQKCMGGVVENMAMKYNNGDYQYTLYYYDQAGNLVKTVPPQGVHVETNPTMLANFKSDRLAKTLNYPTTHGLSTVYTYNALNQLVRQTTPDGGTSYFWYDKLGRLVASRNAKQKAASASNQNYYSYTVYDALGRIAEVGEMNIAPDFNANSSAVVSTFINPSTNNYPANLTPLKKEVTKTFYGDDPAFVTLVSGSNFTSGSQDYLRSRVASVTIEDADDNVNTTFNHATHYSYDVHGNVKELIQENRDVLVANQKLKKIAYTYDLVSGKVNTVSYQPGAADLFLHRYEYDADNRITSVFTSRDGVIWDRDAKYFYYLHGPLARVETGQHKVQGTDYAYTLQGWIKGVNSNTLRSHYDIGKDGDGFTSINGFTGRDAFGYSLTYFKNDYLAINETTGIQADDFVADASVIAQTPDLYNGNIRQMVTSYLDATSPAKTYALASVLKNFSYDQLNRIKTADATDMLNGANQWLPASVNQMYAESFTYDQNGNILTASRNGHKPGGSLAMDNLNYNYIAGTNKLNYVTDGVSGDPYSGDLNPGQLTGNYTYDAIGNLIGDVSEGITAIDWTVYGKIKRVRKQSIEIRFKYDASGNRVSKAVLDNNTNNITTTFYARDAQGNVMAVYEEKKTNANVLTSYLLQEQHIYGSSRLGTSTRSFDPSVAISATNYYIRGLGFKNYEMSNHLGNVIATVSDKKIGVSLGGSFLTRLAFQQDFSIDYSGWAPLGATLSLDLGRLKVSSTGTNGNAIETLPTIAGQTYTLTFDLDMGTALGNMLGRFAQNSIPVAFTPVNGSNTYIFTATNSDKLALYSTVAGNSYFFVDNVKLITTEPAISYFTSEVLSANDYYAFGSIMPGRSFNSNSTRYGFNGQEKDNDIFQGALTAEFWEYDSRTGRRWNIDPVVKIWESPYACFNGNPIAVSDPNGDDGVTGLIDAAMSFGIDVGMDYISGIILEGKTSTEAFADIGWAGATWGAVKTYALAIAAPPGTSIAMKIKKVTSSTIGKTVISVAEKMSTKIADNYLQGKYDDVSGNFDFGKVNLQEAFYESAIETLVEQGLSGQAEKLLESLKNENSILGEKLSKLIQKATNGESTQRITRYSKVVDAQKEIVAKTRDAYIVSKVKEKVVTGTTSKVLNSEVKSEVKKQEGKVITLRAKF